MALTYSKESVMIYTSSRREPEMEYEFDTDIQCEEIYEGIYDTDGDFYSLQDLFTFGDEYEPLYEKYKNTHEGGD